MKISLNVTDVRGNAIHLDFEDQTATVGEVADFAARVFGYRMDGGDRFDLQREDGTVLVNRDWTLARYGLQGGERLELTVTGGAV